MKVSNAAGSVISQPAGLTVILAPPVAPDVAYCLLYKQQGFVQNDAGTPAPDTNILFSFWALLAPASATSVISATVQAPAGIAKNLVYDTNSSFAAYIDKFSSQTALDAAYGPGSYVVSLTTLHDGKKTMSLIFPATASYPNVPHVSNFSATQSIDPATDFRLSWDPFIGGTTNDSIRVRVQDSQGHDIVATPDHSKPGSLNGTDSSLLIPANFLVRGQVYRAFIYFFKSISVDLTQYAGVPGVVLFATQTSLNLIVGSTASPFRVDITKAPGTIRLEWPGLDRRIFEVQSTSNLKDWSAITLLTGAGTNRLFWTTAPTNAFQAFRIRLQP